MDLGTIMKRVNKNEIKTVNEIAELVRLTFSNAMLYNQPGSEIYVSADKLLQTFEKRFSKLVAGPTSPKVKGDKPEIRQQDAIKAKEVKPEPKREEIKKPAPPQDIHDNNSKKRKSDSITNTPKNEKIVKHDVKETVIDKEMTTEEKRDLGAQINTLTEEQIEEVVKIMDQTATGDTLEIDLDQLDNKLLRKLEAYVHKCIAERKANEKKTTN